MDKNELECLESMRVSVEELREAFFSFEDAFFEQYDLLKLPPVECDVLQ